MKTQRTKPNPLAPVLPQLRGKGVLKVKINYSGGGDEGAIDRIDCTNENDEAVEIGRELEGAIETAVFDLLEEKYSGWEVSDGENDGADGTITLTFGKKSCETVWNHNAHYRDTNTHTIKYKL